MREVVSATGFSFQWLQMPISRFKKNIHVHIFIFYLYYISAWLNPPDVSRNIGGGNTWFKKIIIFFFSVILKLKSIFPTRLWNQTWRAQTRTSRQPLLSVLAQKDGVAVVKRESETKCRDSWWRPFYLASLAAAPWWTSPRVFVGTRRIWLPVSFLYQTCILRNRRVLSDRQRGFHLIICGSIGSVQAVFRGPWQQNPEEELVHTLHNSAMPGKIQSPGNHPD